MKPRLLLDIDGVLADFVGPFLDTVDRVLGKRFQREDVDQWDVCKAIGLSPEDGEEITKHYVCSRGWCESMPVFDGAKEGVKRLQEIAEVYFVTSPMKGSIYWMGERTRWMEEHFGVDSKHVVFTSHKHIIYGDALVDDGVHNLRTWHARWKPRLAICWDTPHNRNDEWSARTNDWDQLVNIIEFQTGNEHG